VTSTDQILALAASAVAPRTAASVEVTQADIDAFSAGAARGAGSDVVRALLAIRPAASASGDPAWTAWVTAAAATAAASEATGHGEGQRAGPVHPAWLAVFAAGAALSDSVGSLPSGITVTAAITAGMGAAAVTETGLADWGGWSSGTVAAVIGAGVTAGLLLGLTEPQLRATLSICATQAAGLAAAEATQAFALQVGKAAFNGVEAALLARAGLTAPAEPLDGRRGLFALFG
jgi:2-methylcitrate dehydratase PrpD